MGRLPAEFLDEMIAGEMRGVCAAAAKGVGE
jgi:hypothetical protein